MGNAVEIRVPDIGDFKDIPVIELLVKPGDVIAMQDSVATLESAKRRWMYHRLSPAVC